MFLTDNYLHPSPIFAGEFKSLSAPLALAKSLWPVQLTFNCGNGTAHFKNINSCQNTKTAFLLETSGGQNSNLHLNAHVFNTSVNQTSVATWHSCFLALVSSVCSSINTTVQYASASVYTQILDLVVSVFTTTKRSNLSQWRREKFYEAGASLVKSSQCMNLLFISFLASKISPPWSPRFNTCRKILDFCVCLKIRN